MNIINEAIKFKEWEGKENPCYKKYGEWEVDYLNWDDIYASFKEWIKYPIFNQDEINSILYLISRDNECEIMAGMLRCHLGLAKKLASHSINSLHSNAKWQLVKAISSLKDDEIDELIYRISIDRCYYVQRICLMESAKRNSKYTYEMIEWSWLTHDEYQMIAVLWSLYWIKDNRLLKFIEKAKTLDMKYLKSNADEILNLLSKN